MDNNNYMELYECMDKISLRLDALHSMIQTLHVGMMAERMSKQTLACVESINFCISDIKTLADECLVQVSKNGDIINENEMA